MRVCAIIPAYDAARTVGEVVSATLRAFPDRDVLVVDDGSRDDTARIARRAGAHVLAHGGNRGKGAAVRTGLVEAAARGFEAAVTIDADGQHLPEDAARLAALDAPPRALIIGVRDLAAANAPRANRISNGISNFFLSVFTRRLLADTQCGLRRYPLPATLLLGYEDDGYAFEAEVILRAIAAGMPIVQERVRVIYPPERERVSHFDSVRDPARIVSRVVRTLVATRGLTRGARLDPAPDADGRVTPLRKERLSPPPSVP